MKKTLMLAALLAATTAQAEEDARGKFYGCTMKAIRETIVARGDYDMQTATNRITFKCLRAVAEYQSLYGGERAKLDIAGLLVVADTRFKSEGMRTFAQMDAHAYREYGGF